MDIKEIGKQVVDSSIKVHRALGPGLLESAYQFCLAYELRQRGLDVEIEAPQQVFYDGQRLDVGYRLDMLVENCVIIENKVVETLLAIHEAQLLTYLKLRHSWLGFLINWNTIRIKDGIKRMVNGPKPIE